MSEISSDDVVVVREEKGNYRLEAYICQNSFRCTAFLVLTYTLPARERCLYRTMFAVLQVLLASAAAVQALNIPTPLTREQVGARILAELAKNTDDTSVQIARQLIGGGDDYAPYEVPCPSNFEWIRPASVSLQSHFHRGVLARRSADCRDCLRASKASSSNASNTSARSTRSSLLMDCPLHLERPSSGLRSLEADTEP